MRTNIVIDDALMAEVMGTTGAKTKREAVELGLQTLLRLRRQEDIRQARGKLNWTGDLDAMRTDSRSWSLQASGSTASVETRPSDRSAR